MNCREAEPLLGAYLDGELDPERRTEVEVHWRDCGACLAALERLERLSVAVESAPYYPASPELRARLEGRTARRAGLRRPWIPLAVGVAAAAVVALLFVLTSPRRDIVASEVVQAHLRSLSAGHLWDVPASGHHAVHPWLAARLDFPLEVEEISSRGFSLAGGRLDSVAGRSVAALVYRRGSHLINVFVWPAEGQPDREPVSRPVRGWNVVDWRTDGLNWWAVSDLEVSELQELPLSLCFLPAHETLRG